MDSLLRHRTSTCTACSTVSITTNGIRRPIRIWRSPSTATSRSAVGEQARAAGTRRPAQRDDVPLVAMVTRLDWQKGLDITGHVLHLLMNGLAGEAQFVVLGTGARSMSRCWRRSRATIARRAAFLTYAADLAPLIYGGSDSS